MPNDYPEREIWDEEPIAILRFTVDMDEQFEPRVLGELRETRQGLEAEIREVVSERLGDTYSVSRLLIFKGTIKIYLEIAGAVYFGYVGISRYKNFVESIRLLIRDVQRIIQRFVTRSGPVPAVVTGTWIPGPPFQQHRLYARNARAWGFAAVLGYLILSHAALLAVLIWRVIHLDHLSR
jgi:hypothetical protein